MYHIGADLPTLQQEERNFSLWSKSCEKGDLPSIKELLSEEPWHLDQRESLLRYSGLHFAINGCQNEPSIERHFECVKYLVEEGADVNAKDLMGMPVLAPCLGILEPKKGLKIADYLVKHGADVNARDRFGFTLLFSQSSMNPNFESSVEWLLRNGADVNAVSNDGEPLRFLPVIEQDREFCQLLKKLSLEECKRQKEVARKSADYKTCPVCMEREDLKRCSGCYLKWYCSRQCQVIDTKIDIKELSILVEIT